MVLKRILRRLFPLRTQHTGNQVSHHNYIDGRWFRIDQFYRGRRWPQLISNLKWVGADHTVKVFGRSELTRLEWPIPADDAPIDPFWDPNIPELVFEGTNVVEWLSENCEDEFQVRVYTAYFAGWAKPVRFAPADAVVHVEFLSSKDAMLFKLSFQ